VIHWGFGERFATILAFCEEERKKLPTKVHIV
jgi:hypothetical protein